MTDAAPTTVIEPATDVTPDDPDLALLRRHEPLLRFTNAELFFPMDAASYVAHCDLLEGPTLREARVAIPAAELDLDRLAEAGDPPPGQAQFLRFVAEPFDAVKLARWRNRPGSWPPSP